MTHDIFFLTLICCTTAHFVMAATMGLFARYQIKYEAIEWILAIFGTMLLLTVILLPHPAALPVHLGMLNPYLLLALMVVIFLQSILPLGMVMPAYLEWGRMFRYAVPAALLLVLYGVLTLIGFPIQVVDSVGEYARHLLSIDMQLRLCVVGVSAYYVINTLKLPNRLTRTQVPGYLKGYSMVLGASALFYLVLAMHPSLLMAEIYILIFTLLNLYLSLRMLESMALTLPRPVIARVEDKPEPVPQVADEEQEDFNELNLQRFQQLEYWMQHNHREWKSLTFNRDRLSQETGLNRHLMLQCVRSQGYNNLHDYINVYRVEELKRMIERGRVHTLTDCLDAGFGTVKTVRACFLRHEGITLDQYLEAHIQRDSAGNSPSEGEF